MSQHDSILPVTVSQELFWAGAQLAPDSPLYNMAFRVDFTAPLDPEAFSAAIDATVAESDALRCVFAMEDDNLTARVLPSGQHRHRFIDLGQEPDPEAAADRYIAIGMGHRFDLALTTLDSALLRLGPERHVWWFNQHHIATDAGSASLFYRRVGAHYARLTGTGEGPEHPLPAYADHARNEQQERRSRRHAAATQHWQERVAGPGGRLHLYGQSGKDRSGRSVRLRRTLGGARLRRLEALAGTEGIRLPGADLTRFALLATACFAFLGRVSGERSIALGATTHNRQTAQDRETIGLYVELFPLAVTLEEGASFRSLFAAVAEEAQGLLFYGRPGASSAATARQFNVILNYLNTAFGPFAGMPTRVEWADPRAVDPGHALRFNVYDFTGQGDLTLGLDINTELFGEALLERIPDHFFRVLDAMLEDFDAPVDAVPLVGQEDPADAVSMLVNSGPVPDTFDGKPTVVSLFDAQAAAHPRAVALQLGQETLSYAALQARSEALAQMLRTRGVGAGDIVGICARRSPELVIAVFGVLRAGAAFAPLEPGLPRRRRKLIVEDTRASVVLVDAVGREAMVDSGCDSVTLITIPPEDMPATLAVDLASAEPRRSGAPQDDSDPAQPAYVYYTSGSTGRPKGVVVGHAGLADYISWSRDTTCPDGAVDFPLFSAFGFDLTVNSLFVPFASGGRLVIYPEPPEGTDLSVREVFADDAVDVVKLTPSHLALVLGTARRPHRIRTLLFSGEALNSDLAARGQALLGAEAALINEYGPTEAIVGCTWHRFDAGKDQAPGVPIGVPARGASIYLLDAGMNPVPAHVEGEVFIGGDRLAQGYLGQPERTAERFLPDPFRPGGRMYRTGDRAIWDGKQLHYCGRSDGQVKVRGNRIELGEVEHAITACDGVVRCVVRPMALQQGAPAAAEPSPSGDSLRLVAYFTSDGSVDVTSLRGQLAEVLTEAMIPHFFVPLDEIPMTPNGKVDSAALPAPGDVEAADTPAFRAPVSPAEQALAALWSEVLGLERVGRDDSFFRLGGDSIAVIQVVDRGRARGMNVTVPDFFEQPTLAALARCVAIRDAPAGAEVSTTTAKPFGLSGLDAAGLARVAGLLGDKPEPDERS